MRSKTMKCPKAGRGTWNIDGEGFVRSDGRAKVLPNPHPQLDAMLDYHYLDDSGEWRIEQQFFSAYLMGSKKSDREVLGEIVEYEPIAIRRIEERRQRSD